MPRHKVDRPENDAFDAHIGRRLRQRRTMIGMSQEKLGVALGLSFQQVQKYERGFNRLGASRLVELGRVLDVPVAYFFQDGPGELPDGDDKDRAAIADALQDRDALLIAQAFTGIADPAVRRSILDLVRGLASAPADAPREEA